MDIHPEIASFGPTQVKAKMVDVYFEFQRKISFPTHSLSLSTPTSTSNKKLRAHVQVIVEEFCKILDEGQTKAVSKIVRHMAKQFYYNVEIGNCIVMPYISDQETKVYSCQIDPVKDIPNKFAFIEAKQEKYTLYIAYESGFLMMKMCRDASRPSKAHDFVKHGIVFYDGAVFGRIPKSEEIAGKKHKPDDDIVINGNTYNEEATSSIVENVEKYKKILGTKSNQTMMRDINKENQELKVHVKQIVENFAQKLFDTGCDLDICTSIYYFLDEFKYHYIKYAITLPIENNLVVEILGPKVDYPSRVMSMIVKKHEDFYKVCITVSYDCGFVQMVTDLVDNALSVKLFEFMKSGILFCDGCIIR